MSFTETVEEAVFGFDFLIIPVNFQTSVTNINVGLVEPGIPPLPDGSRLLSDYAFFRADHPLALSSTPTRSQFLLHPRVQP